MGEAVKIFADLYSLNFNSRLAAPKILLTQSQGSLLVHPGNLQNKNLVSKKFRKVLCNRSIAHIFATDRLQIFR